MTHINEKTFHEELSKLLQTHTCLNPFCKTRVLSKCVLKDELNSISVS